MEEAKKKEAALLPLDAPRRVALKGKSQIYIWNLRRPSDADWMKYFTSIVNETLQVDGHREQVFESEGAVCELVDKLLTSVEGYGNMTAALPFNHYLAVGYVLRNVGAADAQPEPRPGLVEVTLNATWAADGQTSLYSGLVHRFRTPPISALKEFNYNAARVKVRGTSKDGVTSYPSRQAIALQMYDGLIESVDGYSVSGAPLIGVEAIQREMDGAHKAAAALQLFDGGEDVRIEQ